MDDFQREQRGPEGNEAYTGTPPSNRQTAGGTRTTAQHNRAALHFHQNTASRSHLSKGKCFFCPAYFLCLPEVTILSPLPVQWIYLNGAKASNLSPDLPGTGKLAFQDLPPNPTLPKVTYLLPSPLLSFFSPLRNLYVHVRATNEATLFLIGFALTLLLPV